MGNWLRHIVVSLLLVALPSVTAASLSQLVASPERPKMAEVIQHLDEINFEPAVPIPVPVQRWLPQLHKTSWQHFLEQLKAKGPEFVVNLEEQYPGATWAFMGRDTQALGDLMDAFYIAAGEYHRVVRVGVSSTTFHGIEVPLGDSETHKKIVKYLSGLGLDLKNIDKKPPFVLVDTISGGGGRQMRLMLNAVYNQYVRMGKNPRDLMGRFDLLGLAVSTTPPGYTQRTELQTNALRVKFQFQLSTIVASFQENLDFASSYIFPVLASNGNNARFNEVGYDHFTLAWHSHYLPLLEQLNGKVISQPGPLHEDLQVRKSILWFQKQIWNIVSNPEFVARAKMIAQSRRMNFPYSYRRDLEAMSCSSLLGRSKR